MILLPWPAEFGPIPRGMPMSGTRRNTQDRACGTLLKFCPGFLSHGYWRVLGDDGEWMMDDAEIDLSAPTDGERIDALPEVVARLARAMGLDPSEGVLFALDVSDDGGWRLTTSDGWIRILPRAVQRPTSRLIGVPTLSSIDPTEPHATRLAVSAIVAARPWRSDAC